jgi:hypothetical protein
MGDPPGFWWRPRRNATRTSPAASSETSFGSSARPAADSTVDGNSRGAAGSARRPCEIAQLHQIHQRIVERADLCFGRRTRCIGQLRKEITADTQHLRRQRRIALIERLGKLCIDGRTQRQKRAVSGVSRSARTGPAPWNRAGCRDRLHVGQGRHRRSAAACARWQGFQYHRLADSVKSAVALSPRSLRKARSALKQRLVELSIYRPPGRYWHRSCRN